MSDCRMFKKEYPNCGFITITYYSIGYPVIETDYSLESNKPVEMEKDEDFFKFKNLNNEIENLLKEKGFEPCTTF